MIGAPISGSQRFSVRRPCPICGGWATMRRGRGTRCWGFLSSDHSYAHCTRVGGNLAASADGTYAHRLDADCRCGAHHGQVLVAREPTPEHAYDASAAAQTIWQHAHHAPGSVVETYLATRGLAGPIPPSIRAQRLLRHTPSQSEWPALIAAVTRWPGKQPVAIQRTWLKPDGSGKAPLEPPRMSLGPVRGGAVRLAAHGAILAIAEGVETALSVQRATGLPAWAVLGVRNMPALILPDDVMEIVVAADNDPDGVAWACAAARRWKGSGHRVHVLAPPDGTTDFNDLLRGAA